ncbi:MAG: GNAT family N-acetyltransferase [Bacteroidales bacterium]|nr:GNAT family N-acetyltransferase [Bacteroidales bacterium]
MGDIPTLKISIIKGLELSNNLIAEWKRIQKNNINLSSPFFCPEFTYAISLHREDSYIAILERENKILGFFPFHKDDLGNGSPIGFGISDYHGIIIGENDKFNILTLLKDCNIKKWRFDHQIASQSNFLEFSCKTCDSPTINLQNGYDQYLIKQRHQSKVISKTEKQIRRLEQDFGTISFALNVNNNIFFKTLFNWKTKHLQKIGKRHKLNIGWVIETMEYLRKNNSVDFSGMLSVLMVEDKPISIEFGISSHTTLHGWVSSYDLKFQKYSPGLIMQLRIIQNTDKKIIDLGKTMYHYKERFMNNTNKVLEGFINI